MTDQSFQNRFQWADFTRALSALMVVLAHVLYRSSAEFDFGVLFYYSLTRVAVPVFFMVSGFLLLSKQESYSDFFRKRAVKVFVPFLVWSLIYLLWKREAFDQSLFEIAKIYFIKIVRGPREAHLWFFYELFGLYLLVPILRLYVQRASDRDLMYLCAIWFIMVPVKNFLAAFTPLIIGVDGQFFGGYIGYFVFGYLAARRGFSPAQKRIAWLVFLAGFAATMGSLYFAWSRGLKTQYFEEYLSMNIVLMACAFFAILTHVGIPAWMWKWISLISRASFGVYLVHILIMTELFSLQPFDTWLGSGSSIYMIPLLGAVGFVSSLFVVLLLQKIPILKYIVS